MAAEEGGVVIACHKRRDFDGNMAKGMETGKLVIIEFTASWSKSCLVMASMFAKYAKMYPGSMFLTVDVDERKQVAAAFDIRVLPTFVFIRHGENIHTLYGTRGNFYAWLAAHAT